MDSLISQEAWLFIGLCFTIVIAVLANEWGFGGGGRPHGTIRPMAGRPAIVGANWRGKPKQIVNDIANDRFLLFLCDFPKEPVDIPYAALDAVEFSRDDKAKILAGNIRDLPIHVPSTVSGELVLRSGEATNALDYMKGKNRMLQAQNVGLRERVERVSEEAERTYNVDVERMKKLSEVRSPMETMMMRKLMKGGGDRDEGY